METRDINEMFDKALMCILELLTIEDIVKIPGVYEILSAQFRNEAIDIILIQCGE